MEVDKANIHAAIERWYGSLPAFSEFVQGLFRARARELTRTPGRIPLGYIYMLAAPSANFSLDVWLGLWKAGASSEGLVAWFVGGFLAFSLLWLGSPGVPFFPFLFWFRHQHQKVGTMVTLITKGLLGYLGGIPQ